MFRSEHSLFPCSRQNIRDFLVRVATYLISLFASQHSKIATGGRKKKNKGAECYDRNIRFFGYGQFECYDRNIRQLQFKVHFELQFKVHFFECYDRNIRFWGPPKAGLGRRNVWEDEDVALDKQTPLYLIRNSTVLSMFRKKTRNFSMSK